jgi:hypothetical protein
MELTAILQAVNHVQGALVTDGGRPGEFKGKFQLATIGASERAIDLTRKLLSTIVTEWCDKPW